MLQKGKPLALIRREVVGTEAKGGARVYTCLSEYLALIYLDRGRFYLPPVCLYYPFKVHIQTARYWLFGTPGGYAGKEAVD